MCKRIWAGVFFLVLWGGTFEAPTFGQSGREDTAATTRPAGESDVPVRQVVLFSSGVGYFEHFGSVRGDGSAVLRFKTDQINDILKSLLLEDLDGGSVGTVSFPSQAPVDRTLKSFQVDITSNPPLSDLLNQLRGAKLTVSTSNGPLEGTILGVEKKRKAVADKEPMEVSVLNLRNARMIRPVPLDDVQGLEMDDAKLNQELDAALSALAQARDQDKKPVEIHFNGQGQRRVRIGYVVETPVWKTSYRLVVDRPKNAKNAVPGGGGKLQGWAIIENQTDNDWNDVQLSLVSGRPISFIEDLYHSLYVTRPFVQPQLYASLRPQTYENGITKEEMDRMQEARAAANEAQATNGAGIGQGGGSTASVTNALFYGRAQPSTQPQEPIDPTASVAAAASASRLGELFQYSVGNVSLKRQQSAMIPIVTDDIDAEKVSIYNRLLLKSRPLNGVRLKNTTHKHLLQGPVTEIEGGSYAGDARIDDIPPGQERLLSYGIDLEVPVQVTDEPPRNTVQAAKLVNGVLRLVWKDTSEVTYVFDNKADSDKIIVLEHPRAEGWKLVEPVKADETADSVYRFQRMAAAGAVIKVPVRMEMTRDEELQVLSLDPDKLEVYAKLAGIPDAVRGALNRIIDAKQTMASTQREITSRTNRIAAVSAEQSRIRENMKAVPSSTDYYARLLKKLDEQETQIEAVQKEIEGMQAQLQKERKELETKVNQLSV